MANTCSCGCSSTAEEVTRVQEACQCGCGSSGQPRSKEQELLELLTLRDEINQRLQELKTVQSSS